MVVRSPVLVDDDVFSCRPFDSLRTGGLGDEEATERLVRDGKIGYVGSSNFAGWHPPRGAKAPTFPRVVTEQSIHKANDAN